MTEPAIRAWKGTDNFREIIKNQREFFKSRQTLPLKFRKHQLKLLKKLIVDNEKEIFEALKKDLNKHSYESFGSETAQVVEEINYALKHLDSWAKPQRVGAATVSLPSRHTVYPQPIGICYVIGAWNYPVLLNLSPVVGAIAAGNCVILKPSELSVHTSTLLCRLLATHFDESFVSAIFGGADVSQAIIQQKPDYIFFTGSTRVGKIVMKAAAEELIPVTLELGGKSPCIVDEDANLEISARRVVFGKLLNGGQTCVAPDFVMVHEKVRDAFLKLMKGFMAERYGSSPEESRDICRIINKNHFLRLKNYLECGIIYHGGNAVEEDLYIEPTILTNVAWGDPVMIEEIFGPILPVFTFYDLPSTIKQLNEMEKPLAAYYFGKNKSRKRYFIEALNFGGGVINDTIFHFGNPELPIGGIGASGMGRYHGKYSFDTFSHLKSVVSKPYFAELDLRYPPYINKLKWLRMIFRL